MDTSKEYIEMCKKAVEIQESWQVTVNDIVDSGGVLGLVVPYIEKPILISKTNNSLVYIVGIGSLKTKEVFCIYLGHRRVFKSEEYTWLPRQDQLQDMFYPDAHCHMMLSVLNEFLSAKDNWHKFNLQYFSSLEQLWLAFVMKEKHNKHWNGTDWVTGEA